MSGGKGNSEELMMPRLRHVGNLLSEVWSFAWQNKAWWIVPTVIVLLLMGVLIFSGQAVAPFIYTLF
jgi:hypothetical protein